LGKAYTYLRMRALLLAVLCAFAEGQGFVTRRAIASYQAFEIKADIVVCPTEVFPKPYCPPGFRIIDSWNATSAGGDMKLKVDTFALTCETYAYCAP